MLYHIWWISPSLQCIGGRLSPDADILSTDLPRKQTYSYVGTGQWRNRGLNLVHCLQSILGDGTANGETIEFIIRRLQLQFLTRNETRNYSYTREVQLYPTSNLVTRLSGSSNGDDDGYLHFVTQSMPLIDEWAEFHYLLDTLKGKRESKQLDELLTMASRIKHGDAGAAAQLARQLVQQQTLEHRGTLVAKSSPHEAASLDGPSIAVLQKGNQYEGHVPPEHVAGFELKPTTQEMFRS